MIYYNDNNEMQAIHILEESAELKLIFSEELTRTISFTKDITIISNCSEDSILYQQCRFNGIRLIKLDYINIINQLNSITSKYVLLIRGDAILLENFSNINEDLIIAGQNTPNSKYLPINCHKELEFSGENKFANPYMIFGEKTKLIDFFEDYFDFCKNSLNININSIQEKIEINIFNIWLSENKDYKIDSEKKWFDSITKDNCRIIEKDNARYLKIVNNISYSFRLF